MTPVQTPADLRPLTTLRFLAALWVVMFAAWPHLDVGFVPVAVTKGYLGVEVFFVLSGFILSHVYLEAAGPSAGGWQAARRAVAAARAKTVRRISSLPFDHEPAP